MIALSDTAVYLLNGREIVPAGKNCAAIIKQRTGRAVSKEEARRGTITSSILQHHHVGTTGSGKLNIKFDVLTAHDITYVSIIQTAKACGMETFPVPFIMTNCHNSLGAVGGTINEDDHMFALSAAKKYGGIYVPPHLAVIHAYNREMTAKSGAMILGSDSHTRYGALGTMGVGEGGGELVKQLLGKTYDLARPEVIAVYLTGKPQPGVGPMDIALTMIGHVFSNGYVKNKVMEFIGDGIANLSVEFRNGIDVMTTETACWSSIWQSDQKIKEYYTVHGRADHYTELKPQALACYDGLIYIDLSRIKPTMAMPFHPSHIYTIEELKANPVEIMTHVQARAMEQFDCPNLKDALISKIRNGAIYTDQGIIAGCAGGGFDNIVHAADIITGKSTGNGPFSLSVYPASQPVYLELVKNGTIEKMINAGVIVHSAFCGPCFGAGDTPAHQGLSLRHTTRNFPNREGSKPAEGQLAYVALADARSIAATAINGGKLTAATEIDVTWTRPAYYFHQDIYQNRVFDGAGRAQPQTPLKLGPNIKDWPAFPPLPNHLLLKVITFITDPVTTTDELIPSGETSSYRSNPLKLAEFTLSRKDPAYVDKAKKVQKCEIERGNGKNPAAISQEMKTVYEKIVMIRGFETIDPRKTGIGSTIYANKPGDGSAREQAASCQRILGTWANLAREYATKRYRSNLINWGMLPFIVQKDPLFREGDFIFIPHSRKAILGGIVEMKAFVIGNQILDFTVSTGELTGEERKIIVAGGLINYYRSQKK